ncbi:hypothetical protein NUACC21_51430 [Scytonema sp. NUACC21]
MPNASVSLTDRHPHVLKEISTYIYQTIVTIQDRQPELLLEKYRNISWRSDRTQSNLIAKLSEVLSQTQDSNTLIEQVQKFLKVLLFPEAFHSKIFLELVEKIRQGNFIQLDLDDSVSAKLVEPSISFISASITSPPQKAIAVLLLDAENLQISAETEKFLTTVCNYPIQIKIAFANWCSMGKLDIELHERSYDLIHVPVGKDNADGKMITFGSTIHERFPNTKEVFVCSSDKVMTNLCNILQQNGLTVYRVSKNGDNIVILNSNNGHQVVYSPKFHSKISSLEKFINTLKELIKEEQKKSGLYWVKFNAICQSFQNKYKISISEVVSTHVSGKKAKDIFIEYPNDFCVHHLFDEKELYITLFEITKQSNTDVNNFLVPRNSNEQFPSSINSISDLEKALILLLKTLISQSKECYIAHGVLAAEFCKQYGEGITKTLNRLQIAGTFTKFLESSNTFQVDKSEKNYRVSLL